MKYFDIYLKAHFAGYGKSVINRVSAEDYDAAIVAGFCGEVHNLTKSEVADLLADEHTTEITDGEMILTFENAIELFEVPVMIDGKELIALLPKPDDFENMKYFKD